MRSFHPMPALLIELPVLARKEIEQQAIERAVVPVPGIGPEKMRIALRHDLEQCGRDDLPSVSEIQPLVVLLLREPTRDQVENFGRSQGEKLHVSTPRAAGETREECHRASYAASSFGASWRHSSSFSTRLRPYLPISARRAGSSSRPTIFAARSTASFFCA